MEMEKMEKWAYAGALSGVAKVPGGA